MGKVCGIYKITSPSCKVYVGQSEDIYRRWTLYRGKHILGDSASAESYPTILRRSFKKHGFDKHNFEIIENCEYEKLNEREMFWISFYDSYNTPHGMNCTKGGGGVKGMIWSEESRLKASLRHKGQIQWNVGIKATEEHIEKNRKSVKEAWARRKASVEYYSEEQIKRRSGKSEKKKVAQKKKWVVMKNNELYYSKEEIERRRLRAISREQKKKENGYKVTEETKKRNSLATQKMWDRKKRDGIPFFSEKALENMRNAIGNRYSKEANEKNAAAQKKLILNIQTGIFYFGLKDAAASTHISYSTLSHKLGGSYKNNTSFIYV